MDTLIKLDKYFFEPDKYDSDKKEIGNDKVSMNGTYYMQKTGEIWTFDMSFEGVIYDTVLNLEYINNKCKPSSGDPTPVDYIDLYGDHYSVVIPLNGLKYTPSEGDNKLFDVELKLREV